jgi:hypothetical protein
VDTELSYMVSHVAPNAARASAAFGVETRRARGDTVLDSTYVKRWWSAASEYEPVGGHALGQWRSSSDRR